MTPMCPPCWVFAIYNRNRYCFLKHAAVDGGGQVSHHSDLKLPSLNQLPLQLPHTYLIVQFRSSLKLHVGRLAISHFCFEVIQPINKKTNHIKPTKFALPLSARTNVNSINQLVLLMEPLEHSFFNRYLISLSVYFYQIPTTYAPEIERGIEKDLYLEMLLLLQPFHSYSSRPSLNRHKLKLGEKTNTIWVVYVNSPIKGCSSRFRRHTSLCLFGWIHSFTLRLPNFCLSLFHEWINWQLVKTWVSVMKQ